MRLYRNKYLEAKDNYDEPASIKSLQKKLAVSY